MSTYEDAFWKGAQEVFNSHKMAFWGAVGSGIGALGRVGIGAGIGAAGGLMMRDEGESYGTTLGRMAFGAGVGGLAGGYGPRMWQAAKNRFGWGGVRTANQMHQTSNAASAVAVNKNHAASLNGSAGFGKNGPLPAPKNPTTYATTAK